MCRGALVLFAMTPISPSAHWVLRLIILACICRTHSQVALSGACGIFTAGCSPSVVRRPKPLKGFIGYLPICSDKQPDLLNAHQISPLFYLLTTKEIVYSNMIKGQNFAIQHKVVNLEQTCTCCMHEYTMYTCSHRTSKEK